MTFIIPLIITVVAMSAMAAALHFSQYKKRQSSCCGGGVCSVPNLPLPKSCGKAPNQSCDCK